MGDAVETVTKNGVIGFYIGRRVEST